MIKTQSFNTNSIPFSLDSLEMKTYLVRENSMQVSKLQEEGTKALKTAFKHAIAIGILCLEVKNILPHGAFGKWQDDFSTVVSARTLRKYMAFARDIDYLEKMAANAKIDLTINIAERLLKARNILKQPKPQSHKPKKREPKQRAYAAPTAELEAAAEEFYCVGQRLKTFNMKNIPLQHRQVAFDTLVKTEAISSELQERLQI